MFFACARVEGVGPNTSASLSASESSSSPSWAVRDGKSGIWGIGVWGIFSGVGVDRDFFAARASGDRCGGDRGVLACRGVAGLSPVDMGSNDDMSCWVGAGVSVGGNHDVTGAIGTS